jgi:hypothetical protein
MSTVPIPNLVKALYYQCPSLQDFFGSGIAGAMPGPSQESQKSYCRLTAWRQLAPQLVALIANSPGLRNMPNILNYLARQMTEQWRLVDAERLKMEEGPKARPVAAGPA